MDTRMMVWEAEEFIIVKLSMLDHYFMEIIVKLPYPIKWIKLSIFLFDNFIYGC